MFPNKLGLLGKKAVKQELIIVESCLIKEGKTDRLHINIYFKKKSAVRMLPYTMLH